MADESPIWVAVLLDWQNVYRCAREAFGLDGSPSVEGSVHPLKLARHLASGDGCHLQEVRIYRGRPDNAKDQKGYSAWRSQTAAWETSMGELLVPRYRDLRYRGGNVVEKGIDVWLAIDLARIAMERTADRLIVMTSDTDLVPAIEFASEIRGQDFIEDAGWDGPHPSAAILTVEGAKKQRLDRAIYDRVHDATDYNLPARARKKMGWDAQIQAEGKRRRQPKTGM